MSRMPRSGSSLRTISLAAGVLGALAVAVPALGATPVGSEFQVNTYTTGSQSQPSVAVDPDGDFVVVWYSDGSSGGDTSNQSIQGQRYDASGSAAGAQFQVNTYTTSGQFYVAAAMDADGDFVVVWKSNGSLGNDTSVDSVQGQRYDANGNAVGGELQVNTYTTGNQIHAAVAMGPDGNFVVVWASGGSAGTDTSGDSIQGQRYDGSGNTVGGQFQVNTYTTDRQVRPSVAINSAGDFVVTWPSRGSSGGDNSLFSIQAQRYDGGGNAVGSEFQVNTYTTSNQYSSSVAMGAGGDFVVVWHSYGSAGSDTSSNSVQGQRYDAAGDAVGGEFQVNTFTNSAQISPSVANDPNGGFVVVWESLSYPGDNLRSIQGQRYNTSGATVGTEFHVNTYTTNFQRWPFVAVDADGGFVVVWQSDGSAGSDSSFYSVQGQRYEGTCPGGDLDGDGVADICDPCPTDATDTCDEDRSTSETVGSGGGSVSTPDDSVTLDIPAGALDGDTVVTVTDSGQGTSFQLATQLGVGEAAYLVTLGPAGTVFNEPITVTLAWDDEPPPGNQFIDGTNIFEVFVQIIKDGAPLIKVDGSQLGVCGFEPGPLAETGAECDRVGNTFKVQVLSLSDFALFQLQPVVPALRPTGVLALTALLLVAGVLLLRRRLRLPS